MNGPIDIERMCTTCAHMTETSIGMACLRWRSPADGRPMSCGMQRTGTSGCGREGAWWEARDAGDPATAQILADPAASYWLKAAAGSALSRDPLDALADAETLVMVLKARCENIMNDT